MGTIATGHHAMLQLEPTFSEFTAPYILFQGGVDKIVDVFGPLDLEEKCKSKDKTTIYCENMWHDAMNE
jgi:acylglycerol lipase